MKKVFIISLTLAVCLAFYACEANAPQGSKREYYFISDGVAFTLGDDADKAVEALGEPNSISRAPSCAGEGQDELYIYNGFKIYAHRDEHACRVNAIELTNDTVKTEEGARIGDKSEKIIEIYGKGEENNGVIEYSGEGCILRFLVREGRVSGIKYLQNDS